MHSSRLEGGANVISEAIIAGTPLIASRIAGNVGLLGEDYPGYFEVGDTQGLARLLERAGSDAGFLPELKEYCARLAHLFSTEREEMAWAELIDELFGAPPLGGYLIRDGGAWSESVRDGNFGAQNQFNIISRRKVWFVKRQVSYH